MMDQFWDNIRTQNYIPDDTLQANVSTHLHTYLDDGLCDQSRHFRPKTPGVFFVHGGAGIGKSSFVKTFCHALQELLQQYVDPDRRVDVVKVPLNALTPANFRNILKVKGISDWSIERILEQTITKGNIALFHLEEAPEDIEQQAELFELICKMLEGMGRRYPEFMSHVFHLFTSNYVPAPSISARAAVIHMQPPNRDRQMEWLVSALKEQICGSLSRISELEISLDHKLPDTGDMRPLKKFVCTVGFLVSTHCHKYIKPHHDVKLQVTLSGTIPTEIQVDFCGKQNSEETPQMEIPSLQMSSADGFFFYAGSDCTLLHGVCGARVSDDFPSRIDAITSMVTSGYLQPAVIVLTGADSQREALLQALNLHMRALLGSRLVEVDVSARSEEDKVMLVGHPHEINGGLFKIIGDANSPASMKEPSSSQIVLIVARVNEVGQFLLREMMEDGDSKTHSQAISMQRVLFLVSIDDGCHISSPLLSRAHDVV